MPGAVSEQLGGCDVPQEAVRLVHMTHVCRTTPANKVGPAEGRCSRAAHTRGACPPQLLMCCLCTVLGTQHLLRHAAQQAWEMLWCHQTGF